MVYVDICHSQRRQNHPSLIAENHLKEPQHGPAQGSGEDVLQGLFI
jgi:hypothetical protein